MEKKAPEVVLAREDGQNPVLTLRPATVREFRAAQAGDKALHGQNLFLAGAALRALAQTGAGVASKGTYRIVTDPKFARRMLANMKGSASTYRGFYRDGGKIVGHAKFKPVNAGSVAMFAVALLEVATVVTSTVHLQDIARQLKEVKELARKLHDLLDDQRTGRLLGNLAYLHEIWTLQEQGLQFGGDTDRYSPQLEAIYRECLGEIHTARQQIGRRKQEIARAQKIRVSGKWLWKKVNARDTEQLQECVQDFSSSLHIALLAQETAAIACAVGIRLGFPAAQSSHRMMGLAEHVSELKRDWSEYGDLLRAKFEDITGRPETQNIQKELAGSIAQHRNRPKALAESVEAMRRELDQPSQIELLVKVEDGQAVDVRRVLETSL